MWPFSTPCSSKVRLDGKTVVITGANTGIGKETARDLYWRGRLSMHRRATVLQSLQCGDISRVYCARVVLACRDLTKANAAAEDVKNHPPSKPDREQFVGGPGGIVICQLDLSSLASVRECAKQISDTEEAVHILINNAAIAICAKSLTADGFEMQFGTNHLGHFLFTLLLLPKIIQSRKDLEPCRIVNVSSVIHTRSDINFDDLMSEKSYGAINAYGQSKLANILFARELARRLKAENITGVNTYSLHPGGVNTDAGRHLDDALFRGAKLLHGFMRLFMKTAEQGAQTILHCALDQESGTETSLYYQECRVCAPSMAAQDDAKASKLWDESIKLVGLPSNNLPELIGSIPFK